ncbi:MAG TPA: ribosome-associated translation inhibitor RaiA [Acidimicrobiia bacterium]|nr:ribosome-associated translation inhibitor RaiA [Acidimicrobiia bacterium]
MDVIVRGRHLDVPDRLRNVTERKLAKIDRFAPDVLRVDVEYSEQRNPRIADAEVCTVTVTLKRRTVKAHAAGPRQEVALDLVLDKLEQQIRRIKERRIGRSQPKRSRARGDGAADVPSEPEGDEG